MHLSEDVGAVARMCLKKKCMGTSRTRPPPTLGPYSRPLPRALCWSWGCSVFVWSKYPLLSKRGRRSASHEDGEGVRTHSSDDLEPSHACT